MSLNYRPEIDGLRAIAVATVIIYHANFNFGSSRLLPGGFLGVDIFFVISGYLITLLILKEVLFTKKFNFYYFYERRIRRILPAYLFILLISLFLAWIFLPADALREFANISISSIFFLSNFYFSLTENIYGQISNDINPLIHLWSLSVEEQYYIIFPIITVLLLKFIKKNFLFFLVFLFLISFFLSNFLSIYYPSSNFYLLPTRLWELCAGSILAYCEIKNIYLLKGKNSQKIYIKLIPCFGFLLILLSIFLLNNTMKMPSYLNLGVVLGTALIIFFSNKNNKDIVYNFLTKKIIVFIGLISYSLYLIHQPIFAFVRITGFSGGSDLNRIIIVFVLLIISIFSYHFIEKPCRDKKNAFRVLCKYLIFVMLFIFLTNCFISYKKGFPERGASLLQDNFDEPAHFLLKNQKNKNCLTSTEPCMFNVKAKKKIYLIGDSIASTLGQNLKEESVNKNYQLITHLTPGCLYFPGLDRKDKKTYQADEICNSKYFKELENEIISEKNSILIIFGRYPVYINKEYLVPRNGNLSWEFLLTYPGEKSPGSFEAYFKKSLLKIASNGNKIVLVYPVPEMKINVRNKLFNTIPRSIKDAKNYLSNEKNIIAVSYQDFVKRNNKSFSILDDIKHENIFRVYPHKIVCNKYLKNKCIAHDDKNLFLYDDHHPTYFFSTQINKMIFDKIFK